MSVTAYLWYDYKTWEEKVFEIVFTKPGKPKPADLQTLISSLRQFLEDATRADREKAKVRSFLKSALVSREKSREEYAARRKRAVQQGNDHLSALLSRTISTHAYYSSKLDSLLPENLRVRQSRTTPGQTPGLPARKRVSGVVGRFASLHRDDSEATEPESELSDTEPDLAEQASSLVAPAKVVQREDKTVDEDEFDIFWTLIECELSEILRVWKDMLRQKMRPIVAAAVTNCIYSEMDSSLERARLLAPQWFDRQFLRRRQSSFQEGLDIMLGLQDDSLWNRMKDIAPTIDRSILPKFIDDLILSFVRVQSRCSDPDFYIFRFSVWLRLLHLIQSIEDKSCFDELQKDACCALDILHDVFSRPMIQKAMPNPVDAVIQEARRLKPIVQGIDELSLVCNICLWSAVQLHEVFLHLLETPLITMTAHVYVYLRLSQRSECIPQLEVLCNKHEKLLFWDGSQPLTLRDWETSYRNWVTPTNQNAQKIACIRSRLAWSNSLLRNLALNSFKLTTHLKQRFDIKSTGSMFDKMRLELERGIPSDTVALYDTVSRTVPAILARELGLKLSANLQDVVLAHFFYRCIDRVAEPFISQIATMPAFA
ncbi:hypothetical protein N7523_005705 [Penicillium sp. IBT 18751x]|nr:hypothetical protein N7523_005705 [Penicillium sp. IBT 18751x]